MIFAPSNISIKLWSLQMGNQTHKNETFLSDYILRVVRHFLKVEQLTPPTSLNINSSGVSGVSLST